MKSRKSIILLVIFLFSHSPILYGEPIIGYGSSDAVLPEKNQELFYMGFELGYQSNIVNKNFLNKVVVEHTWDGTQLGAGISAKKLFDKGVKVIVGFPTSHEALIVARMAKKKKMLSIFSGASHSDLAKMGPTVFTTGDQMGYSAASMLDFITETFSNKKGIMVSNPKAIFSMNLEKLAKQILKKEKYRHLKMKNTLIDDKRQLDHKTIQGLKSGQIQYIFITYYADESVELLQQLKDNNIDVPIISNTSWTTGDIEFLRRFLTAKKTPTYSGTLWIIGAKESLPFEERVWNRYKRKPSAEIAYGYDLGIIVSTVMNRLEGSASKENLIKAFHKDLCFEKITSGQLCFNKSGGYADRKIYIVVFKNDRFISYDYL